MSATKIVIQDQAEIDKLVDLVNASGLAAAARKYDTHPSTLSRWLRKQGFQVSNVWKLTHKGKLEVNPSAAFDDLFPVTAEVENAR